MRFLLINDMKKVGMYFSQPTTPRIHCLPSAFGPPNFFPSPKMFIFFFILMSVAESMLDRQQCHGAVSKCKFLVNFKVVIAPAI